MHLTKWFYKLTNSASHRRHFNLQIGGQHPRGILPVQTECQSTVRGQKQHTPNTSASWRSSQRHGRRSRLWKGVTGGVVACLFLLCIAWVGWLDQSVHLSTTIIVVIQIECGGDCRRWLRSAEITTVDPPRNSLLNDSGQFRCRSDGFLVMYFYRQNVSIPCVQRKCSGLQILFRYASVHWIVFCISMFLCLFTVCWTGNRDFDRE